MDAYLEFHNVFGCSSYFNNKKSRDFATTLEVVQFWVCGREDKKSLQKNIGSTSKHITDMDEHSYEL